jgi:hypothetical protein
LFFTFFVLDLLDRFDFLEVALLRVPNDEKLFQFEFEFKLELYPELLKFEVAERVPSEFELCIEIELRLDANESIGSKADCASHGIELRWEL